GGELVALGAGAYILEELPAVPGQHLRVVGVARHYDRVPRGLGGHPPARQHGGDHRVVGGYTALAAHVQVIPGVDLDALQVRWTDRLRRNDSPAVVTPEIGRAHV